VKILAPALKIVDDVTPLAENANRIALQGLSDSDIRILINYLNIIVANLGQNG